MAKAYSKRGKISKYLEKLRFKIADKLNESERHCWADLAMFGMGYNQLKNVTKGCGLACKEESKTHSSEMCYCGKFYKGELLTDEKAKVLFSQQPDTDDLPF